MNPDTLLAHIASQTRGGLEFLVSQNQLTESDCQLLLQKLRSIEDVSQITTRTQSVSISHSAVSSPTDSTPPRAEIPNLISPPGPTTSLFRVRAIWGYNEHNQNQEDLSFYPNDIIDVLNEINKDWWEGRSNGRVGVFPSNYVERIASPNFPTSPTNAPPAFAGEKSTPTTLSDYHSLYSSPSPGHYAPQPMAYPNPPTTYPNPPTTYPNPPAPMANPPPPQATVVANEEQQPNQPKKKLFQGKLGNTLAHSAVGGVGFGAG
ncbi:SH3-domain-containing protein [Macrolepiota fuliginosa MF-IS2]|uniref:SH3-domain-containing protein n=1 Tax=Macrolepiota fuliginosa MF-IS2 TaxID=1400762 RepID=A0A9P5XMH6_9AGAR|nr:SH3-domain-containing protein [Macrolepiota fuliginosa MF-IS2]